MNYLKYVPDSGGVCFKRMALLHIILALAPLLCCCCYLNAKSTQWAQGSPVALYKQEQCLIMSHMCDMHSLAVMPALMGSVL
jgi:hypothetical protein